MLFAPLSRARARLALLVDRRDLAGLGGAADHAEPTPMALRAQDRLGVGLRLDPVALFAFHDQDLREAPFPLAHR